MDSSVDCLISSRHCAQQQGGAVRLQGHQNVVVRCRFVIVLILGSPISGPFRCRKNGVTCTSCECVRRGYGYGAWNARPRGSAGNLPTAMVYICTKLKRSLPSLLPKQPAPGPRLQLERGTVLSSQTTLIRNAVMACMHHVLQTLR